MVTSSDGLRFSPVTMIKTAANQQSNLIVLGFEVAFGIAGLLVAAYSALRRRR
ncbi:MAG: hypothetical protein WA977_05685 [Halobacteriota archaeon]